MRRTRLAASALMAGGLLSATAAAAQDGMGERRASRFDLGVYAGGSLTSGWLESRTVTLNGTPTPVENDDAETYRPGFAPAFGAAATFWMTPAFGIRAHGAYLPMRLPNADGVFEAVGERRSYVMNTYFYDLNLALRPFAASTRASRALSSVYFFVGGGGLTVDLAGEDRRECQPNLLALGACLSYEPAQATVGQGNAGAGIALLPLAGGLSLFGEAGVHVYDAPTHVGDEWVGPARVPTGSTVRIADDRVAVTGRLAIGLMAMFGNLLPPPPMVAPPPPPVAPPPPPPPSPPPAMRELRVCVVQNGQLREVAAMYDTATGDTMANNQRFSTVYPATMGYAAGATWYINNEGITVMDRRYVRYGLPRVLGVNEVTRMGEYMGVPVFAEAGQTMPEVIYVPVRPGCEFQPYQTETKTGGVRGD